MPPPLPNRTSPPPAVQTPGWWQRHWRWALPLLGVSGMGLFACAMLAFASALFGMMRSSDVYITAMQRMRGHPQVVAALGTPIEPGWYLTGSMKTGGASGKANLQIPISGPKGEGDLYLVADKTDGRWTYSTLIVTVDGRDVPIDLLASADAVDEPAAQ